jgi:hypothetical protein
MAVALGGHAKLARPVLENALAPMAVTASRPVIEVSILAPQKAFAGTVVAPVGHAKLVRAVASLNARKPMAVTASRPVIEVSSEASKAASGTTVAPAGHAKVSRLVPANALSGMEVTASWPVIEVREEQLANAPGGMCVVPAGMTKLVALQVQGPELVVAQEDGQRTGGGGPQTGVTSLHDSGHERSSRSTRAVE